MISGNRPMSERVSCTACGVSILAGTAARNGGLCMPCRRGTRAQVDEGKRRREQERAYEQGPEHGYWLGLVHRVHETPAGFDGLAAPEQVYYAVHCLVGEVHNGGFAQFFTNSSGSLYEHALAGLREMDAGTSAALLVQAKETLFGARPVPADRGERLRAMTAEPGGAGPVSARLDRLDQAFYAEAAGLGERCRMHAAKHRLYAA
jgi:hypothetical protein